MQTVSHCMAVRKGRRVHVHRPIGYGAIFRNGLLFCVFGCRKLAFQNQTHLLLLLAGSGYMRGVSCGFKPLIPPCLPIHALKSPLTRYVVLVCRMWCIFGPPYSAVTGSTV